MATTDIPSGPSQSQLRAAVRREVLEKLDEMGGAPPPLDLWRRLEDDGYPLADPVREWMESFSPSLVLNQTRLRADLELAQRLGFNCSRQCSRSRSAKHSRQLSR